MPTTLFELEQFETPAVISYARGIINDINNRARYIGPTLLPFNNVEELDWKYIVGSNASPIPVMAKIKALEAESSVATRKKQLTQVSGKIPSIARKIDVYGKTLIKLANPRQRGNEFNEAIREVYDDTENMVKQVAARIEWLRCQTVFKGSFTYDEDGVEFSVDFGVNPALQLAYNDALFTTQTAWTDKAASKPVEQLIEAIDHYADTLGYKPERIIGSAKAMSLLLRNENTEKAVFGNIFAEKFLTRQQLNAFLTEEEIPIPVAYDAKVAVEDGAGVATPERLLPENRLVFLPPAEVPLGETLFGPTVEEILDPDIQALNDDSAPRIFAQTYVEGVDPGKLWTKAVANAFPTFPGADSVMYLDLW